MTEHQSQSELSARTSEASLPPARVRTRRKPDEPQAMNQEGRCDQPTPDVGYEVGYKKPPKHTRFKPGQSGNPKGRPKKAESLNTIVRENLTQKVTVRTSLGEKRITRIEAVIHKAVEQAMKGNPRAIAELLKLYNTAVPEEKIGKAEGEREEDLTAADLAMLAAYRQEIELGAGDGL